MDEQEINKESEKSDDTKDEGNKSELAKETDAANIAAERMEKATEELNAAEAKRRLGGIAEGGIQKEKPKEETPLEYRTRIDKEIELGMHND